MSEMRYITLGRTGLRVSKVGLGCGGHAKLGTARGGSEDDAIRIVERALDLGVNFIDTARSYGTEATVGRAIKARDRSRLVLCTKHGDYSGREKRPYTPAEYAAGIDRSLRELDTDYIDLYMFHGLRAERYEHVRDTLLPVMRRAKQQGKVRFICASEEWVKDPGHAMPQRVLPDDVFDVLMIGFNLLNPSSRQRVFPATMRRNVGTLIMFAVREALSKPAKLRELMWQLVEEGKLSGTLNADHALDFLTEPGVASSIPEAAYRFCAHEPGADVILTGTGSIEHLEANVRAILAEPLPREVQDRLRELFGHIDSVTGN